VVKRFLQLAHLALELVHARVERGDFRERWRDRRG
jgi:hypothetical protein